jgi:hypothetical protein
VSSLGCQNLESLFFLCLRPLFRNSAFQLLLMVAFVLRATSAGGRVSNTKCIRISMFRPVHKLEKARLAVVRPELCGQV